MNRYGTSEIIEGNMVVLAAGIRPDDELARQLEGKAPVLYFEGGCFGPR
jgi:hypothetical protein